MAVDTLASHYGAVGWKKKFKGFIATSSDGSLLFLKPQTYMNLSGESVAEAMQFYKLTPQKLIVLHDDLDLQPGQVRVKQGGGAGGHNGLKSIDQHIGQNYWRIRLGIGHPGEKGDVVTNYVLGGFSKADRVWVGNVTGAIASEFDVMMAGNVAEYLSRVTRKISG